MDKKGIAVAFDLAGSFWEPKIAVKYDDLVFEVIEGPGSQTPCIKATVHPRDIEKAFAASARFLGEVCWFHQIKVRLCSCVMGGVSVTCGVQRQLNANGMRIHLKNFSQSVHTDAAHLALAFYREAFATDSPFYRFLSYFKVLEVALPKTPERVAWIKSSVSRLTRSKDSIAYLGFRIQPLILHEWLYEEARNPRSIPIISTTGKIWLGPVGSFKS